MYVILDPVMSMVGTYDYYYIQVVLSSVYVLLVLPGISAFTILDVSGTSLQHLVSSTRSTAPGLQHLVFNIWSSKPGPQHLVSSTWSATPGPRYLVFSTWSVAPGLLHLVYITWSASPGLQHLISSIWSAAPGLQLVEQRTWCYNSSRHPRCTSHSALLCRYLAC